MTTRTIKFYGYGFGSTPATISVTYDGTNIFTGPITTVDEPVPELPNMALTKQTVELFSLSVPVDYDGTKPMTYQVTNGDVIFGQVLENYMVTYYPRTVNPIYNSSEAAVLTDPTATTQEKYDIMAPHAVPPLTQEESDFILNPSSPLDQVQAIIDAHGIKIMVDAVPTDFNSVDYEPRTNVTIDGIPQTEGGVINQASTTSGWWVVNNGSTLACDFIIKAGKV